jgi:hypothetical protein
LSLGFWSREAFEPCRKENRLLAEGAISNILERNKKVMFFLDLRHTMLLRKNQKEDK